jgi:hypothetical protein
VSTFYWKASALEIDNSVGGAGYGMSVDRMESFAPQGALKSYMAVTPQKAEKADFSLPGIAENL